MRRNMKGHVSIPHGSDDVGFPKFVIDYNEYKYDNHTNMTVLVKYQREFSDALNVVSTHYKSVLVIPFLIATCIVGLNCAQIWCMYTKFRRELNPLFVMLIHLSAADLIQGAIVFLNAFLAFMKFELSKYKYNVNILHTMRFLREFGSRYMFLVSLLTLAALAVLKMILITRNKWYTKAAVKRFCFMIWGISFGLCVIDYGVNIADLYPRELPLHHLWGSIVIGPSIALFLYCFAKIFFARRRALLRFNSRSGGEFLKIAVCQLVMFVVSVSPYATYQVLSLYILKVPMEHHTLIMTLMECTVLLHPIFDPVAFFIVYRRKLRKTPTDQTLTLGRHNRRDAFVLSGGRLEGERNFTHSVRGAADSNNYTSCGMAQFNFHNAAPAAQSRNVNAKLTKLDLEEKVPDSVESMNVSELNIDRTNKTMVTPESNVSTESENVLCQALSSHQTGITNETLHCRTLHHSSLRCGTVESTLPEVSI